MKKIQVLERLTEKNLIKDFFDDLAARRLGAGRRAARGPRSAATSTPAPRARRRARSTTRSSRPSPRSPGTPCVDRRERTLRALVPVDAGRCTAACSSESAAHRTPTRTARAIGVSTRVQSARPALADGFEEARHALLGATVLRRDAGADELRRARPVQVPAADRARPGRARRRRSTPCPKLAAYDRGTRSSLARDARGVPRPPRRDQRHRRRALRPPEHAPPAAAADRRCSRRSTSAATTG